MKKVINIISSINFLVAILLLLILAMIAGSFLGLYDSINLIYGSVWFKAIAGALVAALCLCLWKNFSGVKKPFALIHIGLVIVLLGGFTSAFFSCKALLQIDINNSSNIATKENNTNLKLPFTVRLNSFEIEKYNKKPDITLHYLDNTFKTIEKHTVSEGNSITIPENTDKLKIAQVSHESDTITNILIDINGFRRWVGTNSTTYLVDEQNKIYILFLVDHQKTIKGYKSNIDIIKRNNKIQTETIEVNKPLVVDGYKLYQYSYDKDNRQWSGILVKKDPGVWVVYAGYLILICGVLLNLLATFTKKEGQND